MLDSLRPREVRYMNQSVDTLFDLDEGAEIGHVPHPPLDYGTHAVPAIDGRPRIGLELFQPERDAAVARVHFQNHGFHLIAGFDDLRRMLHTPRPSHFADVDETLDPRLEFDERAIVGDIHNPADDPPVHWIT